MSLGLSTLGVSQSQAAPITWGTPTTITDNSALDAPLSLGYTTFVQAVSFGGATGGTTSVATPLQTVNFFQGTAVQAASPPTVGNNTMAYVQDATYGTQENQTGLFNPAGTTVGNDFLTVLQGQTYSFGNTTAFIQFRLSGLVVGQSYALQVISSDDRANSANRAAQFQDTPDGTGNNSTSYLQSSSPYTIGTFTADATGTQYFRQFATAGLDADFQAYTLYTVPEPSTWAMMIGGLGLLVSARRLRSRAC